MNSLIKFSSQGTPLVPIQYDITIEGTAFKQFSTCGAIISNNEDTNIVNGLLKSESPTFLD